MNLTEEQKKELEELKQDPFYKFSLKQTDHVFSQLMAYYNASKKKVKIPAKDFIHHYFMGLLLICDEAGYLQYYNGISKKVREENGQTSQG